MFIGAFIEAILLINIYLPGSTAVLLGSILAAQGVLSLPVVIMVATLGILLAYTVDYFLGKHGWYKILVRFGLKKSLEKTKEKMQSRGKRIVLISCIHPNSGSLSATAAGILHWGLKEFFIWFFISQLYWSTVWGLLFYFFGFELLDITVRNVSLVFITVILYWTLKRVYLMSKENYES